MFSVFCVWGAENGSASEGNCFRVPASFAGDAVGAEVFLRTWVATKRRCTGCFSRFFWSPGTGDSIPEGRGSHPE